MFKITKHQAIVAGSFNFVTYEITDGFQSKRIIDNWIELYNSERPQTALDNRPPDIANFGHAEIRKATRTDIRCINFKVLTLSSWFGFFIFR